VFYVFLHIPQMVLYTTVQALEGSRPKKHAMCSMALAKMKLQSDTQFSLVTTLHEEFVIWGYKVLTFIRETI